MSHNMFRKRTKGRIIWENAPDIKKRILKIVSHIDLSWLKTSSLHCFRSRNSASRAYARIWGLSKIWQLALNLNPSYVIEVLSERFDRLPMSDQDKVLLHEIAHIPKNFSGSLLPHVRRRGKRNFEDRVEELFAQYLRKLK